MNQIIVPVVVATLALSACERSMSPETGREVDADLLISNTTIVGGPGGALRNADVLIKNGIIIDVSSHTPERSAARVIDGMGKYVVPGLVDAHTHPFPIERSFPQFIEYGVTSILVTGCGVCSDAKLSEIRAMGADDKTVAPRVFHTSQHFTMEGRHPVRTYPSPNWVEGETVFYLRKLSDIAGYVAQVSGNPVVGIKLTIEKGPMPPFLEPMPQAFVTEVVDQAHAADLEVLAHISDTDGLEVAHRAGVDHLLHYTGVDIDWDAHAQLVDDLVARDVHWVTTLMLDKSFLYPLNTDWIDAVAETGLFLDELERFRERGMSADDARRNAELAYGEPDPSFATNKVLQKQFDDLRRLHAAGIKLVTGTDVGNRYIVPGYSLHEEMALLEQGGFTPTEILKMATINAAELVGAADSIGSVEVGKRADIVVLGSDPRDTVANLTDIEFVIKGGNPLLDLSSR